MESRYKHLQAEERVTLASLRQQGWSMRCSSTTMASGHDAPPHEQEMAFGVHAIVGDATRKLCHNHSPKFYRTLDRHMPNWRAVKEKLDNMAEEIFRE